MRLSIKIYTILFFSLCSFNGSAQKGTLIEFGWDYPDVSQLSVNLPAMQNTPFDGICFSLQRQIMDAFDTILRQPAYYEQDKLSRLKWGKYKSNFVILWGFSTSGNHWFDDNAWKTISTNMSNLSKALANPGIKGVLFDPEYYYADQLYNPWTYNKKQYPSQSYAEVKRQVKKRGAQFIRALQEHKADLSFLSIWITSLVIIEKREAPLEDTRHALLLPFIEGVLEAKQSSVKVIDGNEFGYYYSNPTQFLETSSILRKELVQLMESGKAKAEALKVEIAQPLFYDGMVGIAPSTDRGFSTTAKWKWVEENTKFAMAATDDITWFYSERLNWWKGPINDTLYQVLDHNKKSQATNLPVKTKATIPDKLAIRTPNVNNGTGYYYLYDLKKPMKTGEPAFSYQFNKRSKQLSLSFKEKIPATLSVYMNNVLFKTINPTGDTMVVKLDKFQKIKVAILAQYADGSQASAIEIYE